MSRPTFRCAEIINDDLTLVRGARQRVTLNKPISVGFSILEISKLVMYEFYYDYLKPKYSDRCKLLFGHRLLLQSYSDRRLVQIHVAKPGLVRYHSSTVYD